MITIDSREHALLAEFPQTPINVKQMTIGDVQIGNNWIFERKTIADLRASILDGRFEEQRDRLRSVKADGIRVGYFIEGCPSVDDLNGGVACAIASIGTEFSLICSDSPRTTARQIQKLASDARMQSSNELSSEQIQVVKKMRTRERSPRTLLQMTLMMIPDIGIASATAISNKYGSLAEFIKGDFNIQGLKIRNEKKIQQDLITLLGGI